MNILFLHPEYDLIRPRSIRLKYLFEYLDSLDELNVKIARFNLNKKNSLSGYVLSGGYLFNFCLRSKIFRVITKFWPSMIWPDRLNFFSKGIKREVSEIILNHKSDVIIIFIGRHSLYKVGSYLKEKYPNLILLYDIGDPFFKNSVHKASDNMSNYLFEKKHILRADGLIVTNNGTKKFYFNTYGCRKTSIQIIPQGVDKIKAQHKSKEKKNKIKIIYSGIFYPGLRNPDPIMEVISNSKKYELDVFGSGINRKLKNIYFFNRLPQERLFNKMINADILLIIDNSVGFQTPGKIFELLAFEKPILFLYEDNNSETVKLVKKYSNIILIKNEVGPIKTILEKLSISDYMEINYDKDEFNWTSRGKLYLETLNEYFYYDKNY